jgi:hypothetical protein
MQLILSRRKKAEKMVPKAVAFNCPFNFVESADPSFFLKTIILGTKLGCFYAKSLKS